MLGAVAGDIVGSRFEGRPTKSKDFELFAPESTFTDDTVLTVAVAECLLQGRPYAEVLKEYYRRYPYAGYGGSFMSWAASERSGPYNSFGNGSAMRVSPVGWYYESLEEVLQQAERSAAVTHNHPEGIKGAQAVAAAIFWARKGWRKEEIRREVSQRFGYDLDRSLEEIRPRYAFDVTCQGSVPEALICFFEAEDFEDALRNAVSLGGDSDTQACIAGAVAEASFGAVPRPIVSEALDRLDTALREQAIEFVSRIGK
jgi:ADP-ribosylglycohydrolase